MAEAGHDVPDEAFEPELPAIPTPSVKRPIGEIFVERGLLTDAQLEEALERQRASGVRLGEILVASGRLSRLELASELADRGATFQKRRPPAGGPAEETPSNGDSVVLPTPEVVVPTAPPAFTQAAAAELADRVDTLIARVDQVAAERLDWKPQVEKTAELLRSRIEHLEEQILSSSTHEAASVDLRSELAALASRIDAIPAPTDEWRHELAQVADNLRIRIERVEQTPADGRVDELRALLDGLTQRLDSLPTPSEEWRDQIAALQSSLTEVGAQAAENGGGGEELRSLIEALTARVESIPAPSDEWRRFVDDLSGRVDAIEHSPREDWGDRIAELAARIESMPAPSDEWRSRVDELGARIDAIPAPSDEWRHE